MTFFAVMFAAIAMPVLSDFKDGAAIVKVPQTTAFTASVWVDARSAGSDENPYPRIFQLPGGYLHLLRNPGFSDACLVIGLSVPKNLSPRGVSSWQFDGVVPLGRWAHVALVCRADPSRPPEVYVNGAPVADHIAVKPVPALFKGGKTVLGNTPGGNRLLDGRLAGFRFEPRALSAGEIAKLAATDPEGKPCKPYERTFRDELPLVDISGDAWRHTVVSSGTDGVYQGHPTTAVAPDGTIYCVWTINHGGPCGPMAKSPDGGRTWVRCDDIMPKAYRETHRNCPTLHSVIRPDGGTNLLVVSSKRSKGGIVISPDSGKTWREAPAAALSSGMPPTGSVMLKDGSVALFGQIRNNPKVRSDRPSDDQSIWMSISKDGGWTWGPMRVVASMPKKNLCEPFCLRSPDGNELCLLIRENRHTARSMMCFSRDEGKTWTKPQDTCWGLSGDRHEGIYLPDGRLFIAFRDRALGSSTYGHYVGWVGTYEDLRSGRSGDFRVRILANMAEKVWDTGYSGVELLKDGTVLCTTYLQYRKTDRSHSVVCARFSFPELMDWSVKKSK